MTLHTKLQKILLYSILATSPVYAQSFNVDGYMTNEDSYTHKTAIHFFNGHEPEAYGTYDAPIYQTYVHWGEGTLSGNQAGPSYFFMYLETPAEVKNMVWGNAVTAADIAEYDVQYSNHHGDNPTMDYNEATGSEYVSFYDKKGNEKFWSYLQPDSHSGGYGMLDAKTSVDYLLDNGLATKASSDARDVGMAFEYQFTLNSTTNNELLDVLRDGGTIEYHLSPERGLIPTQVVPEPSSTLLIGLSSLAFILRRKRKKDQR